MQHKLVINEIQRTEEHCEHKVKAICYESSYLKRNEDNLVQK